jgi:CubicO group peptidase (beta-lactamase class C family)
VRDAFAANFARGLEVGASCAAYVDGVKVVDLWGGVADVATGRPWTADTLTLVYSATKGVTAVCTSLLVQRGELEIDREVSFYWPEFAAAGKDDVTVRQLLSHRAGLPVLDGCVSREEILEGASLARRLAAQEPAWAPGSAHGYHALTFGWLVGELVARITGRSVGRFLADEIAGPLGLDVFIGLPEVAVSRVARLVNAAPRTREEIDAAIADPEAKRMVLALVDALGDPSSLVARAGSMNGALSTPDATVWSDPALHAAEIPAGNAITNARSLARLYAACVSPVDGQRLLSDETLETVTREEANGPDAVLLMDMRFGAGFQLHSPTMPMLSPASFGHAGTGGALGFADRAARVGFGYAQNQLGGFADEPRTAGLIDALRRSL